MKYITYKKRLEIQLNSYINFVSYCDSRSYEKLLLEILNINQKIENIDALSNFELKKRAIFYSEIKESKLNYIEI